MTSTVTAVNGPPVQVLEPYRKRATLVVNTGTDTAYLSDNTNKIGIPLPAGIAITWDKDNPMWVWSPSTTTLVMQTMDGTYQSFSPESGNPFDGWEAESVPSFFVVTPDDGNEHLLASLSVDAPDASAVYQLTSTVSVQIDESAGLGLSDLANIAVYTDGNYITNVYTMTVPVPGVNTSYCELAATQLVTGLSPGSHVFTLGGQCYQYSGPHQDIAYYGTFIIVRIR